MSVTLPGTGKDVATEQIAGAHHQMVKIVKGDVGSATPITDTAPFPVKQAPASAAAVTKVTSSASSGTILAANANRRGATIANNCDKKLYLKFGTTAIIATSWTVMLVPGAYYEVPFAYSGKIDGIWEAGPTGDALVTEIT